MKIKLLIWLLTISCLNVMGQTDITYRYWYDDNDNNFTQGVLSSTTKMELDVSSLDIGLHSVTFQLQDSSGIWHASAMRNFYKIGIDDTIAVANVEYWFDENSSNVKSLNGVNGTHVVDVSSLSNGVHFVTFVIKGSKGAILDSKTALFYKIKENEIAEAGYIEYWFDDKQKNKKRLDGVSGLHDIDVSSLSDGVHHVTFVLRGSKNEVLSSQHKFFYKSSNGTPLITKWKYSVNHSNEFSTLYELTNSVDSLSIISMLPVETCPIRSSCFEFRVEDSIPTLYAKNDVTFYFYDSDNNMSICSSKFVDESVKEVLNVEEIKTITSGVTETMPRPTENEIQWYKFEAEEGDTVAFKCNYATTLQVFSPSGNEIYNVSGVEAVKMNGNYVWENGTYYVAVHDVTATRCTTMKLDFMHMDKYDVVDQDVNTVGDGGYNTITFYGNGFDDLYAVNLYNSVGDTITSVDINHVSNNITSLTFNFSGVTLGNYNALFKFTTEDKCFENLLMVEPATEIKLSTTVVYPTTHLRGSYATYNITVSNNSNMTAYNVPISLRLEVDSIEAIQDLKFSGDLRSFSKSFSIPLDSIDSDSLDLIKNYYDSITDLSQFIFVTTVTRHDCGIADIPMTIPPNSSKKMNVSLKMKNNTPISLETYTPNDWKPVSDNNTPESDQKEFDICCYKDRIKCTADVLSDVVSPFLSPGASCASSIILTSLEAAYDVWCYEGESVSDRFKNYIDNNGNSLLKSYGEDVLDCLISFDKLGEVNEWLERVSNVVNVAGSVYECFPEYTKEQPDCPPTEPKGGQTTPITSHDPNDISGYVAESGSLYIGKQVDKVTYMIEFENDSTFATAPAHTILLADTLDTNVFDVTTVIPLKLQIGDKSYDFNTKFNGIATIDMRPDINAIAQVTMNVDNNGVLTWMLESLDPMTVEPTTEPENGILPINDRNGKGMGFITFSVNLKKGLDDGTEVSNMANIIFDTNEAIATPYWINEIDYVDPISMIDTIECVSDSIIDIKVHGIDERSGIWKYDIYYKPGINSDWFVLAEGVTEPSYQLCVYEDITYGFCVVATDKAGNKEVKEFSPEFTYINGEVTTGVETIEIDKVNINDGILYDLLGRRVENPSPGIYIRNGKKILIK